MRAALLALTVLSGCATAAPPPVAPLPPVQPVAFADLRGSEVAIFPEIDVATALAAVDRYIADCIDDPALSRVPRPGGFALRGPSGAPYLTVSAAAMATRSSALGLGGTGFTPAVKEAIADTVQGRPRCAT